MFHSRFNYLMSTIAFKNKDLADALYIDRSLVSRWRTGKREPTTDVVKQISSAIISLCEDTNTKLLLCRTLELQYSDHLFNDTRMLQLTLSKWLSDDIENDSSVQFNWDTDGSERLLQPTQVSLYSGDDGYRSCVKSLLEMALATGKPFTLYFFGNDSLEWLIRQKKFFNLFSQVINQAKQIGMRVRLIFHISNDSKKMGNYISLWSLVQSIPNTELYGLYGLANRETNRRLFSHVSFAIPEIGAVTGWSVMNSPHQYVTLITDQKETRYVIDDFEILFSRCIQITKNWENYDHERLFNLIANDDYLDSSKEYISHSHALPLATLPTEILQDMLERAGFSSENISRYVELHLKYKRWFEKYIDQGSMEYFFIEDEMSGEVIMPHSDKFFGKTLTYKQNQYFEHIISTLEYSQKFENFHFYPIDEPLYPVDTHIAYGAYLISFSESEGDQITICTHQHFANCVFMHINEAAAQLSEKLFLPSYPFQHYMEKYPQIENL